MTELDVGELKRRLGDVPEGGMLCIDRGDVADIIAALEQGEDYRLRLKATNDVYIEITKKLDAALEDRDRLRRLVELAEIEEAGWRRLVYDNCGCIPEYPADLPDGFAEEWRALTAALEGRDG